MTGYRRPHGEPTPPPLTRPLAGGDDEPTVYDWAREGWWHRWVPLWIVAGITGAVAAVVVR